MLHRTLQLFLLAALAGVPSYASGLEHQVPKPHREIFESDLDSHRQKTSATPELHWENRSLGETIASGCFLAPKEEAKPDAKKGKLVPNKSLDAGEGLSLDDAVAEVAAGGDVIAKDRRTARDIAKQVGGGEPIHELPGERAGPSGKPHYHPATPSGKRLPGHVFY